MIDKTQVTAALEAVKPVLEAVKGRVLDLLDYASKTHAKLQSGLFAVLRDCGDATTARAVLGAIEAEWRKSKTVEVDGIKTVPTLSPSWTSTKSKLVGAWERAPELAAEWRQLIADNCAMSGGDLAESLKRIMGDEPHNVLNVASARYAGEQGSTRYLRDHRAAQAAAQANARRAKKERGDVGANAQGMASGQRTELAELPPKIGSALNKLVQTVAGVWKDIPEAELVDSLNDFAKGTAKWAAENRAMRGADTGLVEAAAKADKKIVNAKA